MDRYKCIVNRLILGIVIILAIAFFAIQQHAPEEQKTEPSFSPPGIEYEENNLTLSYSAGDIIQGTVTLTLDNAAAEYEVTSNFEGNTTLLELLEENGFENGEEFNCSTPSCQPDYVAQEETTSVVLTGEDEIAGFSIIGSDIFPVNEVSLTLHSAVGPSCFPQLFIDVLNDGEHFITNNQTSGAVCATEHTGCFDSEESNGDVIINEDQYCELINLSAAPGYELSATIKNSTEGTDTLYMKLYSEDVTLLGECELPSHSVDDYESLGCIVNHPSAAETSYYVCVTAASSNAEYKIPFETAQPVCGGKDFGDLNTDYDISAKALEFGIIQDFEIGTAFENSYGFPLTDYIQDYLADNYDSDCSPSACAIPITFIGQSQTVSFEDPEIQYVASQGETEVNSIYTLDIETVDLTTGIETIIIDLEAAAFTIPLGSDEDTFELYIDDELVFEEDISVAPSFAFDITPLFVGFGQTVTFTAQTSENITSSTWNFGDGSSTKTTDGKTISHQYLEAGTFDLEVTLTTASGSTGSGLFSITVGDAQEIGNITIIEYRNRIKTVGQQIADMPSWIQNTLEEQIDLLSLNVSLNSLASDYELASTDEEYQEIVLDLVSLDVPYAVETGETGTSLPLLVGFDNVDVSYIESISGSTVTEEDVLASNIAGWMHENLDARISYEKITAFYDGETEILASSFSISTNPTTIIDYLHYLIIDQDITADGNFKTNYNQNNLDGGTYISLAQGQTNELIEFYVIGDFDPEDLGSYISPEVARLGDFDNTFTPCNFNNICEADLGEDKLNCEADCSAGRWPWFVFWIVVLLFIALIVYIILQEWYKRHYERSLFKNPNDLYNLINFVYNARKSGFVDRQSRKKLKESGWKGEQVNYIFKKIDGKRTGMYEIPVFKFIENKKVKKEIEKRQGRPLDRRFVKKPVF